MTWTAETSAKRMIADWPTKITEAWIARHLQAAHDAGRPAPSNLYAGPIETAPRSERVLVMTRSRVIEIARQWNGPDGWAWEADCHDTEDPNDPYVKWWRLPDPDDRPTPSVSPIAAAEARHSYGVVFVSPGETLRAGPFELPPRRPAASDGGVEAVAKAICGVRRRHACSAKPFHPYGMPPETAIKSCGCGFWVENEACARAALTAARVPEMRGLLERVADEAYPPRNDYDNRLPDLRDAAETLLASLDATREEIKP